MTALQNCIEAPIEVLGMKKEEAEERALDLLDLVGLSDKKDEHPSRLSGGQQQRIAIARAIYKNPSLLLLDEATSAMDSQMELTFLKAIQENEEKQTVLAVTHKPNVMNICDRVMLIDNGKIAWDGKLEDYKALVAKRQNQMANKKIVS